jgi:hypothetical protein
VSLVLVTVTGTWQGYDTEPAEGTVTFTPYGWRNVAATDTSLAPRAETSVLISGTVSQPLVAPTTVGEAEVRYLVEVSVLSHGRPVTDSYDIVMPVVPAEGAYLDLADRLDTGLMVIGSGAPPPPPPSGGEDDVWD